MTSPESFVSRWARLKRSSDTRLESPVTDAGPGTTVAASPANGVEAVVAQPEIVEGADVPFDPASLPPIDAIGVDTDIRGFLQSRVPAELTRAALRQAWASDPAIRDFIGIAENQWDFNDPDAIPGFGPLPEGYDISELLSRALGGRDRPGGPIPERSAPVERSPSSVTDHAPADSGADTVQSTVVEFDSLRNDRSRKIAAPENDPVAGPDDCLPNHRRHGSALPRLDG
jgi:hypothetical protein